MKKVGWCGGGVGRRKKKVEEIRWGESG